MQQLPKALPWPWLTDVNTQVMMNSQFLSMYFWLFIQLFMFLYGSKEHITFLYNTSLSVSKEQYTTMLTISK